MTRILNLTQHESTEAQKQAGVFEANAEDRKEIKRLLTFETIEETSVGNLWGRARLLRNIVAKYDIEENIDGVMIGGFPPLMPILARSMKDKVKVLHAFSQRVSIDSIQADGSIKKESRFIHVGFVEDPTTQV